MNLCQVGIHGLDKVDYTIWFEPVDTTVKRSSSNPLNETKETNAIKSFIKTSSIYENRVVPFWNNLPDETRCRGPIYAFKKKVARHFIFLPWLISFNCIIDLVVGINGDDNKLPYILLTEARRENAHLF